MTPDTLVENVLEVVSFPSAAAKVLGVLDDPQVRPEKIAELLAFDPGLSAKVLRIANSSMFSGRSQIDELSRAVMILGTALIRELVLGAGAVNAFQSAAMNQQARDACWRHAVCCAALASEIAVPQDRRLAEVAFTAGLTHDLGVLVLLLQCPEDMRELLSVSARGKAAILSERERFGFDRADVGAALARAWRFPQTLVECMAHHHTPAQASEGYEELVSLIHVASEFAVCVDDPTVAVDQLEGVDSAALGVLGISVEHIEEFVERARERVGGMRAALL